MASWIDEVGANPMFLGGAGLAFGGGTQGMFQGMQTGMGMQKQMREKRKEDATTEAWQKMFGPDAQQQPWMQSLSPAVLGMARGMGPEAGMPLVAQSVLKHPEMELERQKTRAQVALMGAQTGYYQSRGDNLDARTAPPDPRVQQEYKGYVQVANGFKHLIASDDDPNAPNVQPDPNQWAEANKPGGLIYNTFGGPVPIHKAQAVVREAKRRAEIGPEEQAQEMGRLGFSSEQVRDMQRSQQLSRTMGKPKVGTIWSVDDNGRVFQKLIAEQPGKKSDITPEMIKFHVDNIDSAANALAGSRDDKGNLRGDGPWTVTKMISNATGGRLRPDLFEAQERSAHAAMGLSYALSGKSVGQAEQKRLLGFYVPNPTDTDQVTAFKLNEMKGLLTKLNEAKVAGLSDAQRERIFDSHVNRVSRSVDRLNSGQPLDDSGGRSPDRPRAPSAMIPPRGAAAPMPKPFSPPLEAKSGESYWDPVERKMKQVP
jgi:hypothetical protein